MVNRRLKSGTSEPLIPPIRSLKSKTNGQKVDKWKWAVCRWLSLKWTVLSSLFPPDLDSLIACSLGQGRVETLTLNAVIVLSLLSIWFSWIVRVVIYGHEAGRVFRMDPKDLILDGNGVMSTCSKTGPEMGSDKDNSIKKILKLIIWKYISQHPIHSSSCLQLSLFCKLQSSKSFVLSIQRSRNNFV